MLKYLRFHNTLSSIPYNHIRGTRICFVDYVDSVWSHIHFRDCTLSRKSASLYSVCNDSFQYCNVNISYANPPIFCDREIIPHPTANIQFSMFNIICQSTESDIPCLIISFKQALNPALNILSPCSPILHSFFSGSSRSGHQIGFPPSIICASTVKTVHNLSLTKYFFYLHAFNPLQKGHLLHDSGIFIINTALDIFIPPLTRPNTP